MYVIVCVCVCSCVYETLRKRKYIWRWVFKTSRKNWTAATTKQYQLFEILGVHLVIHLLPYLWGQHMSLWAETWPKAEKMWAQQQCFHLTANEGWTSIWQVRIISKVYNREVGQVTRSNWRWRRECARIDFTSHNLIWFLSFFFTRKNKTIGVHFFFVMLVSLRGVTNWI